MLYMICPTCGELLGNKEVIYFEGLKKICQKYKIDDDMISSPQFTDHDKFNEEKRKLLSSLVDKDSICCSMRIPTTINLSELIN